MLVFLLVLWLVSAVAIMCNLPAPALCVSRIENTGDGT